MQENKVIDMITGEEVVNLCKVCGFEIVDGKCPNSMNHLLEAAPSLSVNVSDTAGITGKIVGG